MKNLISSLKENFNLSDNIYIDAVIEKYLEGIDSSRYLQFFMSVIESKEFHPMEKIASVSKNYKGAITADILAGTHETAKQMYDKFYAQNCAMTNYTQANREKVPNDRAFFETMEYSKLKNTDGESTYTKQELYVLKELGGGKWLMDMRFLPNTEVAISQIEKIIKSAITTKYSNVTNAIESKRVAKMLRGAA